MSFDLTLFQNRLLDWFTINRRDLPWRKTYDPYQIWISEIMLQQTQMDRGVIYFQHWMKKFPDPKSIRAASLQELLKCWEGLGYYSRVKNIRKCAEILIEQYNDRLPETAGELEKLPGIGPYTAGAISSIAFNNNAPVVDGNIGRLFARVFNVDQQLKSPTVKKQLWQKAGEILPQGRAREFNQALMELGALICTPKKPTCSSCPVRQDCFAYRFDVVHARPVKGNISPIIPLFMATGILVHQGRIFIQQRLDNDIWGGLWEFPGGSIEKGEAPEKTVIREFMEETGFEVKLKDQITTTCHHYTRYRVTLHGFFCSLKKEIMPPTLTAAQDYRWVEPHELDQYAFPSGHRKLIHFLQENQLLPVHSMSDISTQC